MIAPLDRIVVVGTGQAGFQLAASLREAGHAGPVTLVGDEPGLPYQRPPLSKTSVNRPPDHVAARKLLTGDRLPTLTQASTSGFSLKAFASGG